MTTVNFTDIEHDLTGCLSRVEAGETWLIVRGNRPVAEVKHRAAAD